MLDIISFMKNFKFDFANFNNTIPMIDFLESLSIQEKALVYKNMEAHKNE